MATVAIASLWSIIRKPTRDLLWNCMSESPCVSDIWRRKWNKTTNVCTGLSQKLCMLVIHFLMLAVVVLVSSILVHNSERRRRDRLVLYWTERWRGQMRNLFPPSNKAKQWNGNRETGDQCCDAAAASYRLMLSGHVACALFCCRSSAFVATLGSIATHPS